MMGDCLRALVLAALLCGMPAGPALADTDQRCLAACINNGTAGHAGCLQQCTYNEKAKQPIAKATSTMVKDPHRVLSTPLPSEGVVIPPVASAHPAPVPEDRICLQNCEAQGYQYDLCTERCVKACPPNVIICKTGQRFPVQNRKGERS